MNPSNLIVSRLQPLTGSLVAVSIGVSALALHNAVGAGTAGTAQAITLFALGFAIMLPVWLRMQRLIEARVSSDRFGAVSVVLIAFGFGLVSMIISGIASPEESMVRKSVWIIALTAASMHWLQAAVVQRSLSQIAQSGEPEREWRSLRNALVAGAALFLLSAFIPIAANRILGLPAPAIIWWVAILAQPIYLRVMQYSSAPAPKVAFGETGGIAVTNAPAQHSGSPHPASADHRYRRRRRGHRGGQGQGTGGGRRRI